MENTKTNRLLVDREKSRSFTLHIIVARRVATVELKLHGARTWRVAVIAFSMLSGRPVYSDPLKFMHGQGRIQDFHLGGGGGCAKGYVPIHFRQGPRALLRALEALGLS